MKGNRLGYTTGACATAAAKAATMLLLGGDPPEQIAINFPDGSTDYLPLEYVRAVGAGAEAAIIKDAGDDPDVTDGALIKVSVAWSENGISFIGGEGVGKVTKPGLAIPPGEPAINPGPRAMITEAVRELTDRGMNITISIPGGEKIARKTFNQRLGIEGGLSILGTSGRVRPFSSKALKDALKCSLDVALACKITAPVLVPGHYGERAARQHFKVQPEQVIEVSNEWGYMLDYAQRHSLKHILIVGHPGKLAKLSAGIWDTHSRRSGSAVPIVAMLAEEILKIDLAKCNTVEQQFAELGKTDSTKLGEALSNGIHDSVIEKFTGFENIGVVIINLAGEILGKSGEFESWQ